MSFEFQEETTKEKELLKAHLSMEETIKLLKEDFDCKKTSFEIVVLGDITASQIKELTLLKFEVEMTERRGDKVLTTGERESTKGIEDDYEARRRVLYSDLDIHTHPSEKNANGPSFPDLMTVSSRTNKNPSLIAHLEGITFYQKPHLNPITGEEYDGDPRDLIIIYCRDRKVDLFGFKKTEEGFKRWDGLTREERVALQDDFAKKSGAIIKEIPWDNEEEIEEAMDYINLRKKTK